MYCAIDKVDLAAQVDGRAVAIQTDHRTAAEIEAEPELSGLYAMARVINARGHVDGAAVCYVVAGEPPQVLREAVAAAGATIAASAAAVPSADARACGEDIAALADRWFAGLARRAAARNGTRDLAVALRMLEDQTVAAPPERDDTRRYWDRVLELAALTGEVLRAKYPAGRWVPTDRAVVPFGFEIRETIVFPTNRAQRVIHDGADESLFKLLLATDETMRRPSAIAGRLMPSLRAREGVELDEVVWRPLHDAEHLPIVVFGVDGENTFGMIRREALARPTDDVMREALANLAAEPVTVERLRAGALDLAVVSGSFYAAEKLLDEAFLRELHDELGAPTLAAAAPARGVLLVTRAVRDLAELAELVDARHEQAGGRGISPAIVLVSGGRIVGTHPGRS